MGKSGSQDLTTFLVSPHLDRMTMDMAPSITAYPFGDTDTFQKDSGFERQKAYRRKSFEAR